MDDCILRRFPVISNGDYRADITDSVRDVFGFIFPSGRHVLCLKRGDDGSDFYRYDICGFAYKYIVQVRVIGRSSFFLFPKPLVKKLDISENDRLFYVSYDDDGSILMSKDEPPFYDYVEKIIIEGNMYVSKSLNRYMNGSFYAAVLENGDIFLVPIGSARWSFVVSGLNRYSFLIDNIYDFVVRKDGGGEFIIIRCHGKYQRDFEVLNNVGYKA